jgi:predicted DNA-binding protein YlxM (UPF0122 family)
LIDKELLELERQALQQQIEQAKATFNQYVGALAMVDKLLAKLDGATEGDEPEDG